MKTVRMIPAVAVWIFASLYTSALLIAPQKGLQITSMMGLRPGEQLAYHYGWFYAMILITTAAAGTVNAMNPSRTSTLLTILMSGFGLALTLLPLSYSVLHTWRPSFYEYYAGECVTCLALILIAISVFSRQTNEGPNNGVVLAGDPLRNSPAAHPLTFGEGNDIPAARDAGSRGTG